MASRRRTILNQHLVPEVIDQAEATAQAEASACQGFVDSLRQMRISDEAMYQQSAQLLLQVDDKLKTLETTRKSFTKDLNATVKRINAFFRQPIQQYTEAKDAIKKAMSLYQMEKENLRRKALQEAAQAAAPTANSEQPAVQTQAFNVMMAQASRHQVPTAEGTHTRDVWKFEVVDINQVPREFFDLNSSKVNKVVQALKERANIPGVRVWREKTVVLSGKR